MLSFTYILIFSYFHALCVTLTFLPQHAEQRACWQWFRSYLRLTLVFMWNSALCKSSIYAFQEIFTSTDKVFILEGGLGNRKKFYEVLRFFSYFPSRSATRSGTGICRFITNSHALFHLWWMENLQLMNMIVASLWLFWKAPWSTYYPQDPMTSNAVNCPWIWYNFT